MSRQKKIKTIQQEAKPPEEKMPEVETLKVVPETLKVNVAEQLETLQTELDLARIDLEKTKIEIEMKKKELESMPRREISNQDKEIMERQAVRTEEKKVGEDIIEKQRAYDRQLVTGRFMNLRNKGQSVKLPYIKYADDPVKWHPFEHNKVYTIPRGFADQINDHYYTPEFIQKQGEMNPDAPASAIHDVDKSNKRYAFVPINFS